jgi:hypothetical protein
MTKRTLLIINAFLHDLSTGIWAGILITILLIALKGKTIEESKGFLFYIGLGALFIVLLTGLVRFWGYRAHGTKDSLKRRLLIAKHILLGVLFLAGTLWMYNLSFGRML